MRVGHQSRVKPSGQGREPVERRQTAGGDVGGGGPGGGGRKGYFGGFYRKVGYALMFYRVLCRSDLELHARAPMKRYTDISIDIHGISRRTWIPMETYGTGSVFSLWLFLGFQTWSEPSQAPTNPLLQIVRRIFPTIRASVCFRGCSSFGQSSALPTQLGCFAEVSLVFLHSDAAEEPESSRNRNDTGFSCFCSFALTGNSWK